MAEQSLDDKCPQCRLPVGDHTIRGWQQCLDAGGMNYTHAYEEVPGGPLRFDALGPSQIMCGAVDIGAAALDGTALGKVPALVFTFYAAGIDPMSKVPSPTYVLVGTERLLQDVKELTNRSVNGAIQACRTDVPPGRGKRHRR